MKRPHPNTKDKMDITCGIFILGLILYTYTYIYTIYTSIKFFLFFNFLQVLLSSFHIYQYYRYCFILIILKDSTFNRDFSLTLSILQNFEDFGYSWSKLGHEQCEVFDGYLPCVMILLLIFKKKLDQL